MRNRLLPLFAAVLAATVAGNASALTSVATDVAADDTWCDGAKPGPIILENPIFVLDGATLTILPGCVVRGQPRTAAVAPGVIAGTPGALIVTQGGRIDADASATNSIIMTTAVTDNDANDEPDDLDGNGFLDAFPGFNPNIPAGCGATQTCTTAQSTGAALFYDDTPKTAPLAPLSPAGFQNLSLWGGMVINGNAPTNIADNFALAGVPYGQGVIEGLTVPGFPVSQAQYGGLDPHDSSGVMRYVSIRHAGDQIGANNELNCLSLGGVGDGTVLENVECYANFDDGFEWFGGTVNSKNLVATIIGDDSLDLDQGYTGVNQFMLVTMTFFSPFGAESGDKAGEWDGDDATSSSAGLNANVRAAQNSLGGDDICWPLSGPSMYNLTSLGTAVPSPEFDFGAAGITRKSNSGRINMRNGFAGKMYNSIIVNTGTEAVIDVDAGGGCLDSETEDNVAAGLVAVVASTFGNVTAPTPGLNQDAVDNGDATPGCGDNSFNSGDFTGLANADITFDPRGGSCPGASCGKLVAALKSSPIDPRPAAGSTVAVIADGCTPQDTGLDRAATYRGAFPESTPDLWTDGWVTLGIAGLLD